jgi:hypothetical protein
LRFAAENRREHMIIRKLLVAATALSFVVTLPALAKSNTAEQGNGHHYSGGPKTEGHHMGARGAAGTTAKAKSTGGHHYSGGPRAEPRHIGDKN